MRIISGTAKGIKLVSPSGINTRPTTDRIKETLFNIIAPLVYECDFLDLYSGSGAIGLEALSRGSKSCVLVENDQRALEAIQSNIKKTKLLGATIMGCSVMEALRRLSESNSRFDVIFMDPPYENTDYTEVFEAIQKYSLLKHGGMLIVEHSHKNGLFVPKGLMVSRTKTFGSESSMAFIENGTEPEN